MARAALSHTTASWPASRKARDSDASVDCVVVHDQDAGHCSSSTAPGSSM